ncbi:F-box/LRR-repeat protein At4g29420-like [Tasmannia lanceolata]|uniref:F-box/LRR-repeat protein At4g29420-like n=1 Tax=Tasmannia lanceolata TaxID=3420 RepID=UPI00406319D6
MDDLPQPVVIEILSRLNDSTDLARCRIVSKTLQSLSYEVRSLNLICSIDRYLKSRAPETKTLITPFKTLAKNLILHSTILESVSISLEDPFLDVFYEDEDEDPDDLNFTSVDFVSEWLPKISGRLRSLSISDLWIQSCWRRSEVLGIISDNCDGLLSLEVKNAWLSVDSLKPMPMLTSLTLDFIRLDDEELNKLNDCFPSLQVLNLIGVGGLREPKIHLLKLKTCQWTISNVPESLYIHAPNLLELKLKCVKPEALFLRAPLLSTFDLSIEKPNDIMGVERFLHLKFLRIESSYLHGLIKLFSECRTVEKLALEAAPIQFGPFVREPVSFEELMTAFPDLGTLVLGPRAWCELEKCFGRGDSSGRFGLKKLKNLIAHFLLVEFEVTWTFLSFVLDQCTTISDAKILIHGDVIDDIRYRFISKCMGKYPTVRWRWGLWRDGFKDAYFCDEQPNL